MRVSVDDVRMIALVVAKSGFGTLETIERTRSDLVLDAFDFAVFQNTYSETYLELNKDK